MTRSSPAPAHGARRGLPECLFGAARDAWDMGQSPETQADEIAAALACETLREPIGQDGEGIDSADVGEDAPDDPTLPDRCR